MYIHCEGIDVCGYESMCIAIKLWLEIHTPGWASPVSTEMVQPMNDLEVTEIQNTPPDKEGDHVHQHLGGRTFWAKNQSP